MLEMRPENHSQHHTSPAQRPEVHDSRYFEACQDKADESEKQED
jgi:hypothetical protein